MKTLPQLNGGFFLNDSGMETTLVFHEGRDLPAFASFPLLESDEGRDWLAAYFGEHLALAEAHGAGFVKDTPTWRANADWGAVLGYDDAALDRVNREAVDHCRAIAGSWSERVSPIIVSGTIGPRGDGYQATHMRASEAEAYHAPQIASFAKAGADQVTAFTLCTIEEATGIARAAKSIGIPAVISFTLETDGRLASGDTLGTAIETVDELTGSSPAYFMINCAHPSHFAHILDGGMNWIKRIRGIKANASTMSHAELDAMETLDDGDPVDLGKHYVQLKELLPALTVYGGCCGTDHRHVASIASACGHRRQAA